MAAASLTAPEEAAFESWIAEAGGARHSWHPGPGPQRRAAIRRERGRLRSGPGAEHPAARGGTAPVPGRRVRHGPGQPDRGPHPRGESAAGTPATAIAGPRRRDRSLRSGCRGAIDQRRALRLAAGQGSLRASRQARRAHLGLLLRAVRAAAVPPRHIAAGLRSHRPRLLSGDLRQSRPIAARFPHRLPSRSWLPASPRRPTAAAYP